MSTTGHKTDNYESSMIAYDVDAGTPVDVTAETLNSNLHAVHVAILDGSGNHITSFGGGTQYTEDAAAAANPVGTIPILVRADTPAGITTTDGDNVGQRGTDYGAAYVTLLDSSGSEVSVGGGTQYDEDSQHTTGDKGTQMLAVRNDTLAALATTDGDYAPLQVNASGALYIQEGSALDVSAATVTVDGSGFTQPVSGTVTANAGTNLNTSALLTTSAFNAAFGTAGSADTQVMSIQGIASMTPLLVDATGQGDIPVTLDSEAVVLGAGSAAIGKLAANSGVDIGDVDVTSITGLTMSNDAAQVTGDEAHNATDAGNPIKIGGKAKSPDGTDPSSVAENDRTDAYFDLNGRMFVNTTHPRRGHKHLDGSTAYTDESVVADPGDGFQIVITSIIVSTGAATAMNFFLEEGSTKIFGPIYLEATAGRGFVSGPIHLPVTASTAVTITTSASIAQSVDIGYFIQAV